MQMYICGMSKRYSTAKAQGKNLGFKEAYRKFLKKHPVNEVGVDASFWKTVRDRSSKTSQTSS
jgi:hypothetical protein